MIKNIKQLEAQLGLHMKSAMVIAQSKVHQCINSFIKEYYAEYDPIQYERTYSFFNSLVKSDIKCSGKECYCSVYIDMDMMDYYRHSSYDVVDMINRGFHADTSMNGGSRLQGGYTSNPYSAKRDIKGTRFWDEGLSEIQKTNLILDTFIKYMKSKGLRVV